MGITRERIYRQNGQTNHWIEIRNFRDKMRRWAPGREVRLKTVFVDGVPLNLEIYPNGYTTHHRGYVDFLIHNLGDMKIELDYELRIKHAKYEKDGESVPANGRTTRLFCYFKFNHEELLDIGPCGYDEYENSDEALEIQWTIKDVRYQDDDNDDGKMIMPPDLNLFNESSIDDEIDEADNFPDNGDNFRDISLSIKSDENKNLQNDYNKLSEKYDILAKKIEKIESEIDNEKKLPQSENYDILSKKIEKIESEMNKKEKEKSVKIENEINNKKVPMPECPVCLNDMGPGVKIAQCSSGHLLCWTCKEKLSSPKCPTCQDPVNNRAHGVENYVMTLLQYL